MEGRLPAERGAHQHPQGPQVGGRPGGTARHALGRRVLRRAHERARVGDRRRAADLGDAEVGQDDASGRRLQQDVRWLDVAVQDATGVRGAQGGQQGDRDPRGLPGAHGPLRRQHFGQGPPVDQLHHDPGPAVLHHDVVERDDVGMADERGRPRLAERAVAAGETGGAGVVIVLAAVHVQLFDGDLPLQQLVGGTPYGAHATAPHPAGQAVPAGDQTIVRSEGPHRPILPHTFPAHGCGNGPVPVSCRATSPAPSPHRDKWSPQAIIKTPPAPAERRALPSVPAQCAT
ncbi:hypothetical protein SABIM44S_02154 [Streptomyces abikoensis]